MIRTLKVLSLAAMAVLAVSAVAASSAVAANFTATSQPANISGSQIEGVHEFKTDPGTVTCTTATFAGEINSTTTPTQTITPTYSGCKLHSIFGEIAVTVNFNGCDYLFNASGHTEIKCPEGKNVVVSGPGCTVTVPAQTIANGVTFTNSGKVTPANEMDIVVHATASGIKYSYSGFTCGSGSNTTNGTYTGTATIRAFTSGGTQVGITVEP